MFVHAFAYVHALNKKVAVPFAAVWPCCTPAVGGSTTDAASVQAFRPTIASRSTAISPAPLRFHVIVPGRRLNDNQFDAILLYAAKLRAGKRNS